MEPTAELFKKLDLPEVVSKSPPLFWDDFVGGGVSSKCLSMFLGTNADGVAFLEEDEGYERGIFCTVLSLVETSWLLGEALFLKILSIGVRRLGLFLWLISSWWKDSS